MKNMTLTTAYAYAFTYARFYGMGFCGGEK